MIMQIKSSTVLWGLRSVIPCTQVPEKIGEKFCLELLKPK